MIPQTTIETLMDYVNYGYRPGSFVQAVLENDLMEAFGRSDEYNRAALFEICSYVYNNLPSACHGSPEKVSAWLEQFRKPQI